VISHLTTAKPLPFDPAKRGRNLLLIFNYQITNIPNYQILSENKNIQADNENKMLVIAFAAI